MQTYSIILGATARSRRWTWTWRAWRGMNISRHHARIFYDFARRRFALEVIGKNGCLVEGDLLQMGDKQFYFLLPSRSIFDARPLPRLPSSSSSYPAPPLARYARGRGVAGDDDDDDVDENGGDDDGRGDDDVDEENEIDGRGKRRRRMKRRRKRKRFGPSSVEEAEERVEEKDVISSVATVLSDLCGPGEWMPMTRLHEVLLEKYGNIWHHSRVRKYLTSRTCRRTKPKEAMVWLVGTAKEISEHFVINTRTKGG
uniref:FHA domain-containing protein n=1 Tax=Ananas comosus var. bracteatus TaxID=296719 RepID=A0A6V7NNZ7_ANACO|nr:unnamed protein product [Ananas comosus var. bracteatus]